MKFGIVTPTASIKSYCDVEWSNSVKAQTHIDYAHFVVDSSPTTAYATRLRNLLPDAVVVRRPALVGVDLDSLLLAVHTEARQEFLTGAAADCDIYLSWESDVIAPPETLTMLTQIFNSPWNIDIVVLEYPDRENPRNTQGGLGFTAIRRSVFTQFDWGGFGRIDDEDATVYHSLEGWLFRRARRAGLVMLVASNLLELGHRNG